MRAVYTAILYLAAPLVLLRLLWRSRLQPEYRARLRERFGFVAPAQAGVAVWVHAVSVGEALAALPLIEALIARHGAEQVWVTTTTPTGSARVAAALGARVRHSYAPYDLPGSVARFLLRVRPRNVVVMETELWPNLFRALRVRRMPLLIANARLSPNSFRGYARLPRFARRTLADCSAIAAQSETDAQRFIALGAPPQRVRVIGNLKFDLVLPDAQLAAGRRLRQALEGPAAEKKHEPVWVAASTHHGEEEAVLAAHRRLLETWPGATLILVPRHPQRFDAVARLIESSGFQCVRRSAFGEFGGFDSCLKAPGSILLGDSMGEMFVYLAAADVAFVGGSLVGIGGHNVLEPAALGLPVLFGPHMFNFAAARALLLECGAAREVADAAALARELAELAGSRASREATGQAGAAAVAGSRGALARLLEMLDAQDFHAP